MPIKFKESQLENCVRALAVAERIVERKRREYNQACKCPDHSAIIITKAALEKAISVQNAARLRLKYLTKAR